MVAKMPLLMSSRMTSAGLTARSSASSLTVMVPGSSIAPRSRGSRTWTFPPLNAPSRRGGLRGPRRPRVPLLLLATGSSFDGVGGEGRLDRRLDVGRDGGVQCPAQGTLGDGLRSAGVLVADIGASSGESTGRVGDDRAIRRTNDTQQLPLRIGRPADDAGAGRDAPRRRRVGGGAYDATSSAAGAFLVARVGLAGMSGASATASAGTTSVASAATAAFFVTRLGFAGASASVATASGASSGAAAAFFVARFGLAGTSGASATASAGIASSV